VVALLLLLCMLTTVYTYCMYNTGDINLVNGKPWPKLAVEQRTYRMHWLDSSISRDWSVKFIAESADGLSQVIPLLTLLYYTYTSTQCCLHFSDTDSTIVSQ
jgi:hypothetical protein